MYILLISDIFFNMGIRWFFERSIFNIILMLKRCKWHCLTALAVFVLGCILGCVLHGTARESIWFQNRQSFVVIIIYSGNFFSVMFSAIFQIVLYAAALFLLSMHFRLNFLKFSLAFVSGVYLGIYMCIAVEIFGLLGFFYCLLVFFADSLLVLAAVISSFFDYELNCTYGKPLFSNIWKSNLKAVIILGLGCILKLLLIFVILRPFTAFI